MTVNALPMQVELNSGAQIAGSKTRDFWTNPNEDDCNIVFTINDTDINGHKGKYGYISGYKITIDPGTTNDNNTVIICNFKSCKLSAKGV